MFSLLVEYGLVHRGDCINCETCYFLRERILCLMSSDVMRHIRDKLYETLNTNLREKLVGCKTVYFELVHLCRGDPCQDLGGKLNLEIWCPSGLKICILFSSKVKNLH